MKTGLNYLFNKVRAHAKKWSSQSDQQFHDQLFAGPYESPFTDSYIGYLTIRRFADLAQPFVEKSRTVLDLGCGPAEITCELAHRCPDVSFIGVDHSRAGITKARQNAAALGLKNLEFHLADVESFDPPRPVDLALMFDSFHHLTRPARFVERLGKTVPRFLLIEPRGDWKGSQVKEFDFDWLLSDLEKIRRHLAVLTGEAESPRADCAPPAGDGAAAVENRYQLDQFRKMFSGYGLQIRGTLSGIDKHPPEPYSPGYSRALFSRIAYELYRELDERIHQEKMDLLAKHWLIYADREIRSDKIRLPGFSARKALNEPVHGPYDLNYLDHDTSREVPAKTVFPLRVRFRNTSCRTLSCLDTPTPDLLSYHWLSRRGLMIHKDGLHTPLARDIPPGGEYLGEMQVMAPDRAGRYILAIDLVQEGKSWFSEAGTPCLRIPVKVCAGRNGPVV